jgi:hypothetical protein
LQALERDTERRRQRERETERVRINLVLWRLFFSLSRFEEILPRTSTPVCLRRWLMNLYLITCLVARSCLNDLMSRQFQILIWWRSRRFFFLLVQLLHPAAWFIDQLLSFFFWPFFEGVKKLEEDWRWITRVLVQLSN